MKLLPQITCLGLYVWGTVTFCSLSAQVSNRSGVDSTIFISHTVFVPKTSYASSRNNWTLATADMDKDGDQDVITAEKQDGYVLIHPNEGGGKIGRPQRFKGPLSHRALCILDANQDGWPDVATVTVMGKLCLFLNDQKGGLEQARVVRTGPMAHDVTPADLNQDGYPDLAVAVVNAHAVYIHWGSAAGTYQRYTQLGGAYGPRAVKVGDLNGDGRPDLVVGGDDSRVYIHWNQGQGRFAPPISLRSGSAIWALGLADFNQDGRLDIAAAAYHNKLLCMHLNQGDGRFAREQCVTSGDHNFDLVIRDFDLDGDQDVVTCSTVDQQINFHLNDGTGVIGERQNMDSGDWNAAIASADLDQDGDWDLAVASINDSYLHIHRNISALKEREVARRPCLRGIVYNEDTGRPIPRTPVTLLNAQGEQVAAGLSQEDGSFEFCPPLKQPYTLVGRATGLPVKKLEVYMPEEDLKQDIYLGAYKGTFVYGKVRDKQSYQPMPGVLITLTNEGGEVMGSLETDERGNYRSELPFGLQHEITGSYPDYEDVQKYFDLTEQHAPQGRRIDLEMHLNDKALTACYQGVVMDQQTGEPIPRAGIKVMDAYGMVVRRGRANAKGEYALRLPFGSYGMHVKAHGYFYHYEDFTFTEAQKGDCQQKDLPLLPLEEGLTVVLNHIYYDVDKATLRPESRRELDRLVQIMEDNPTLVMEIAGHTDSDASHAYNLDLSHRRAASVIRYLQQAGIYAHRMQPQGYGEEAPVAPNDSPENKQLNRRTEFRVLGY